MLGTNSLERYLLDTNYVRITPVPTGFSHSFLSSGLFWKLWNWSSCFSSCSLALGVTIICDSSCLFSTPPPPVFPISLGIKATLPQDSPLWLSDVIWSHFLFFSSLIFSKPYTLLLFFEHRKHTPMQRHLPFLTFSARGFLSHIYLCSPFTNRAPVSA